MFSRVFNAEEPSHVLAVNKREYGKMPFFPGKTCAGRFIELPCQKYRSPLFYASFQYGEPVKSHTRYSLLYASFIRSRPFKAHYNGMLVLDKYKSVYPVRLIICSYAS